MANALFNAEYYLNNNQDVAAAGYTQETAYQHYITYGAEEAYEGLAVRAPNGWFDVNYYLYTYEDVKELYSPATALDHFLSYGLEEGRNPNAAVAAVDTKAGINPRDNVDTWTQYASNNEDLREAFGIDGGADGEITADGISTEDIQQLRQHYYRYGWNEDRPKPDFLANSFADAVRAPNDWFDVNYYLSTYEDLQANGVTPATALDHFLTYGLEEGRNPNAAVAAADTKEGINPRDNADTWALYASNNEDLREAFGIDGGADGEITADGISTEDIQQLRQHYYQYGWNEDRPKPDFLANNVADGNADDGIKDDQGTGDDSNDGQKPDGQDQDGQEPDTGDDSNDGQNPDGQDHGDQNPGTDDNSDDQGGGSDSGSRPLFPEVQQFAAWDTSLEPGESLIFNIDGQDVIFENISGSFLGNLAVGNAIANEGSGRLAVIDEAGILEGYDFRFVDTGSDYYYSGTDIVALNLIQTNPNSQGDIPPSTITTGVDDLLITGSAQTLQQAGEDASFIPVTVEPARIDFSNVDLDPDESVTLTINGMKLTFEHADHINTFSAAELVDALDDLRKETGLVLPEHQDDVVAAGGINLRITEGINFIDNVDFDVALDNEAVLEVAASGGNLFSLDVSFTDPRDIVTSLDVFGGQTVNFVAKNLPADDSAALFVGSSQVTFTNTSGNTLSANELTTAIAEAEPGDDASNSPLSVRDPGSVLENVTISKFGGEVILVKGTTEEITAEVGIDDENVNILLPGAKANTGSDPVIGTNSLGITSVGGQNTDGTTSQHGASPSQLDGNDVLELSSYSLDKLMIANDDAGIGAYNAVYYSGQDSEADNSVDTDTPTFTSEAGEAQANVPSTANGSNFIIDDLGMMA